MTAIEAESDLLRCCGSRRWARLMAAHRPYPGLGALLAASDEASYSMTAADLTEALAGEHATLLPPDGGPAARTALGAANAEYERRFGRAFVICLTGIDPEEQTNHILAGIRTRLGNNEEEERVIATDELRALVRARLVHLVTAPPPETPCRTARQPAERSAPLARADCAGHEPPPVAR